MSLVYFIYENIIFFYSATFFVRKNMQDICYSLIAKK